jgi:hypothetical protein
LYLAAIDDIFVKILSVQKGMEPHVQIRRYKKIREEKTTENS